MSETLTVWQRLTVWELPDGFRHYTFEPRLPSIGSPFIDHRGDEYRVAEVVAREYKSTYVRLEAVRPTPTPSTRNPDVLDARGVVCDHAERDPRPSAPEGTTMASVLKVYANGVIHKFSAEGAGFVYGEDGALFITEPTEDGKDVRYVGAFASREWTGVVITEREPDGQAKEA
jgi:hypothetical protein